MDDVRVTKTRTRDEVRELDRRAIEEYGIPSIVLMENAGRACAEEALALLGDGAAEPVLVLCGPGNNGGDGLVIARTLFNRGVPVRACLAAPIGRLEERSADGRTNARMWRGLGTELHELADAAQLAAARPWFERAPLVVDALFGTGLTRPLEGHYAALVRAAAAAPAPVLAVDLPSGLDADTGAVLGAAVPAAVTVTFIAPKPGFTAGEGPRLCGRVVVAEIGIPRPLLEESAP